MVATLVAILIHHDAKYKVQFRLVRQSLCDSVAHFSFLDAVAAPAIFAHLPDRFVYSDRQVFIFAEIIIERPQRRAIDGRWIG